MVFAGLFGGVFEKCERYEDSAPMTDMSGDHPHIHYEEEPLFGGTFGGVFRFSVVEYADSSTEASYAHMKKHPVRHEFGMADLEPFIHQSKKLGEKSLPVFMSIADRAKNGTYHNPNTGATFSAHGGPHYGIGDKRDGKSGWASEMSIRGVINNGLKHSRGLWIPILGTHELALGSHGPAAVIAELKAAIRNKHVSEKDALKWVNRHLYDATRTRAESLDHAAALMRSPTRQMIAKSGEPSAFTLRHFLSRKIAPNSKARNLAPPFPIPGYNEILRHLNYDGSENDPAGSPAAVVFADPKHGLSQTIPRTALHHPHYSGHVPGINLGRPKSVPLHELLPDAAAYYMARHQTSDPTYGHVFANLLTSAMKSGKRQISYDSARRLAHDR